MDRENYYILLELPIDPPEEDPQAIQQAIQKKQQQWARDRINPSKQATASKYLEMLADISSVMLTPKTRQEEAEQARVLKKSKEGELRERLSFYAAKEALSDQALKRLLQDYKGFGFTEEVIRQMFAQLKEEEQDVVSLPELPSMELMRNIAGYMRQIDRKGDSLYDFLELPMGTSCGELCRKAERLKAGLMAKGAQSGSDAAKQALCGLCLVVFKDAGSQELYDNYVRLTYLSQLNDHIDEMALDDKKRIGKKVFERLLVSAIQEYEIAPQEAISYIMNYCALNRYTLVDVSRGELLGKYAYAVPTPQPVPQPQAAPVFDREGTVEKLKKAEAFIKKYEELYRQNSQAQELELELEELPGSIKRNRRRLRIMGVVYVILFCFMLAIVRQEGGLKTGILVYITLVFWPLQPFAVWMIFAFNLVTDKSRLKEVNEELLLARQNYPVFMQMQQKRSDVLSILPERYWNIRAFEVIRTLIEEDRADSLKEALLYYDARYADR